MNYKELRDHCESLIKKIDAAWKKVDNLLYNLSLGDSGAKGKGRDDRKEYERLYSNLENALNECRDVFSQYGIHDGKANFEYPKILDKEDTSAEKKCCNVVKAAKKAKDELDAFISSYYFDGSFIRCYVFVENETRLQRVSEKLSEIANILESGDHTIRDFEVDPVSTDSNYYDSKYTEIDNLFSQINQSYKTTITQYKALLSDIESENLGKYNAIMLDVSHLKSNYDTIIEGHINCHRNKVTINFFNNPFDYTGKSSVSDSASPKEVLVFDGTSMKECDEKITPGTSTDIVKFDKWLNFTEDTRVFADESNDSLLGYNVYGNWKITPELWVTDSSTSMSKELDTQKYDMFTDGRADFEASVNAYVATLKGRYFINNRPGNTIVSPNQTTFNYTIAPQTSVVSIKQRYKNGVDSYSDYSNMVNETVNIGSDYSLGSEYTDYTMALKNGEYIDQKHKTKIKLDSGSLNDLKPVTGNVDIRFTNIELHSAKYLNRDGSIEKEVKDIEAYSSFYWRTNMPSRWPEDPLMENGIKYRLCAEPDRFSIAGDPNNVTSDIEITPKYYETPYQPNTLCVIFEVRGYGSKYDNNQYEPIDGDDESPILLYENTVPYTLTSTDSEGYGIVDSDTIEQIKLKNERLNDEYANVLGNIDRLSYKTDNLKQLFDRSWWSSIFSSPSRNPYSDNYCGNYFKSIIIGDLAVDRYYLNFYDISEHYVETNSVKTIGRTAFFDAKKPEIAWPPDYADGKKIFYNQKCYVIDASKDKTEIDSKYGDRTIARYAYEIPQAYVYFIYGQGTTKDGENIIEPQLVPGDVEFPDKNAAPITSNIDPNWTDPLWYIYEMPSQNPEQIDFTDLTSDLSIYLNCRYVDSGGGCYRIYKSDAKFWNEYDPATGTGIGWSESGESIEPTVMDGDISETWTVEIVNKTIEESEHITDPRNSITLPGSPTAEIEFETFNVYWTDVETNLDYRPGDTFILPTGYNQYGRNPTMRREITLDANGDPVEEIDISGPSMTVNFRYKLVPA